MNNKTKNYLLTVRDMFLFSITICVIFSGLRCFDNNMQSDSLPLIGDFEVRTGILNKQKQFEDDAFEILHKEGFYLTWNKFDNADYYVVRFHEKKITEYNWDDATTAAIVKNDRIRVKIDAKIEINKPSVKKDICTGCKNCERGCNSGAISYINEKAVIDIEKCTACGHCLMWCTPEALEGTLTLGDEYYLAVCAFDENDEQISAVTATDHAYIIRITNWEDICGRCGKMCFALPDAGGPGCPADAISFITDPDSDKKGMILINHDKCINCAVCMYHCNKKGMKSLRKEIIKVE